MTREDLSGVAEEERHTSEIPLRRRLERVLEENAGLSEVGRTGKIVQHRDGMHDQLSEGVDPSAAGFK